MLKRFIEFLKSLLILALIASAVYLTYRAWSVSIGTGGDLLAYLRGETPQLPASYTEYEEYSSVQTLLTPLSAVVRSENGLRTLSSAVDARTLFDRTRTTLNEALTTARTPEQIMPQTWREILSGSMALYDFGGAIPLDVIAIFAGGTEVAFPDVTTLILAAANDGTVMLCYRDADGTCYRSATDADAAMLCTTLLSYPADGSVFLYETGADTICQTTTLPRTGATLTDAPVLDGTLSTDANRVINGVLTALGFNSYTTKAYPESDSVRVYVEELNTMRLSDDGAFRFYSPAADTGAVTTPTGLQKASVIADAYDICTNAVVPQLGDAEPYLIKTYTDETSGRFVVLFGIHADGVPIAVDGGYIASFEYCGQNLTTADLHLASYRLTPTGEILLPARQAYVSAGSKGEMVPRFVRSETVYRLGWYLVG